LKAKENKRWLIYAFIATMFVGVWGAVSSIPIEHGFPSSLVFITWALAMLITSLIALLVIHFKIDLSKQTMFPALLAGFLGSGGQLFLFNALKEGPAYIIFPIISLAPILTVVMSILFLKEKAKKKSIFGIFLAVSAIVIISVSNSTGGDSHGLLWLLFALGTFFCWGVQGYFMKFAQKSAKNSESVYIYVAIGGLLLVPFAIGLVFDWDFSRVAINNLVETINWGRDGAVLSFFVQMLNAVAMLFFVYALREGKAMIVSPMVNAVGPVLTVIISLIIYNTFPPIIQIVGIIAALYAVFLLSKD